MTTHHAGSSLPSLPSHQVEVSLDGLVLSQGGKPWTIRDDDVHSVTWQSFLRRRPVKGTFHRKRRSPPNRGYRITRIVHGREHKTIEIVLPWAIGQDDRLGDYRLRVAKKIARRLSRRFANSNASFRQNDWHVKTGCLAWSDGRRIDLRHVAEVRYFGDDVAVWSTEHVAPIRIASDSPDQLILSELLYECAQRNDHPDSSTSAGRYLFGIHHRLGAGVAAFWLGVKRLTPLTCLLAFCASALIIAMVVLRGIETGQWRLAWQDWRLFATLVVVPTLLLSIAGFASRLIGWFRSPRIDVYETEIVAWGPNKRTYRFAELWDYRLSSVVFYDKNAYSHTEYKLRLATMENGSLKWDELEWCEQSVSRGELTYLNDLLRVATNGRMKHESDREQLFVTSHSVATQVDS